MRGQLHCLLIVLCLSDVLLAPPPSPPEPVLSLDQSPPHSRPKRGLLNFAGLIKCMTGRLPFDYNNYGCYCGFGPHRWNYQPMDNIDRCCQEHDLCYRALQKNGTCDSFQMYWGSFTLTASSHHLAAQSQGHRGAHHGAHHDLHLCQHTMTDFLVDLTRWTVHRAAHTMAAVLSPLAAALCTSPTCGLSAGVRALRATPPPVAAIVRDHNMDMCGVPTSHQSQCSYRLCHCDQTAAKCFAHHHHHYPLDGDKPSCDRTRHHLAVSNHVM